MMLNGKYNNINTAKENCIIYKQSNVHGYPFSCYILKNGNSEIISKNYAYISKIDEKFFIVGNVILDSNPKRVSYGIIKLKRDNKGKIIPFREEIIVPIMYSRIVKGNNQTAIACYNGRSTYLELNPNSIYFGKQLVPCLLSHTSHFDLQYEGFAECYVKNSGERLYLPRLTVPIDVISNDNLLTQEEVKGILNKTKGHQKIKKIYNNY